MSFGVVAHVGCRLTAVRTRGVFTRTCAIVVPIEPAHPACHDDRVDEPQPSDPRLRQRLDDVRLAIMRGRGARGAADVAFIAMESGGHVLGILPATSPSPSPDCSRSWSQAGGIGDGTSASTISPVGHGRRGLHDLGNPCLPCLRDVQQPTKRHKSDRGRLRRSPGGPAARRRPPGLWGPYLPDG